MKTFNVCTYFIIYLFYIKESFQTYIIYPFKKSIKEKKIFPENLLQNDLEITLKIGTPPQNVDLNLRSKVYPFFISSTKVRLSYPTFNETLSTSLIKETYYPETYSGQEYRLAYKIYESVIINGKELKNISLFLADAVAYKQSGALGLRLSETHEFGDDLSFIYQIKNKANFNYYSFILRYEDDEKGELIIGSYPHLFDNNFKEYNFYYTKSGTIGKNIDWVLDFDIIRYDNKTINSIIYKSLIQIEFGLIQAPFELKKFFKDKFFNNKCREEFYSKRNITIIHCDKSLNITEFKNLSFILKDIDYEFILSYKDLFIEENNEYIFSIVFDNNTDNKDSTWILGKPFMKKYSLVYDLDRKIIGLYKENNENINLKNNGNKFNIYIIFLIILVLIVIGLVSFIIYYLKKPRRNRAYELNDDNYDYISSN